MKKIIYIANARIPTQKAHGGAIMKMCEDFANTGFDVELVIPRRSNRNNENPFDYYGVAMNFRIKKLLCLDLKKFDKVRFLIQWLSFAKSAALYCLFNKAHWYYGRDELALWFVSIFRNNTVWEAHTAKDNVVVRGLLKRCRAVITISEGLKKYYASLGIPSEKILVAHSGVDLEKFENIKGTKEEIRKRLSLPVDKKIVAYIGKRNTMGESKGVDDLENIFKEIKNTNQKVYPLIVSDAPPGLVPFYMKSADALVMNYPDTEHYAHFMSPLKMFEYMASKQPIITTDLPSVREILNDDSALLVPPGDKVALIAGIKRLLTDERFGESLALNAYDKVQAYTWGKRAQRIINFIQHNESQKREKKIRIAIVVNDFSIGGGMEKQLSLLFSLFDREKFDFHFVTLFEFKNGHTLYHELPGWLPVYRLNFSSSRDVRSWFELAKILSKIQPDIVMSSLFFSNTAVRVIKPFVGYKVIAREHNTYIHKKRAHIFIDKFLSKFTYKIVAVSKTVAEFTSKQEKIPLDKFSVIHNGVNVEFIKNALSKMPQKEKMKKILGLEDFDKIALNVARLTPQKNHKLLIKSFSEFSLNHIGYKLLILGAGSLKKELQKLISDFGTDKRIFLLGHKDNVLDYCRVSEFFISTSEIEGLSNAYLEALSCGLPVVATKTAGTDELIEDGINGFFIKDATIDSVVSALELMADSDLEKLSKNARRKAEEFDINRTISKYHTLFEECYNS